MFTLLLIASISLNDSLPPYHTHPHFGEFWWRVWNGRNQTDTIFDQEGNGFWQKGDTIVWHWFLQSDTLTPKMPLIKGKIEYSYEGRNHDTPNINKH